MTVCLADVCMTGPEERLIGPIKMTINDKIKFEFDYEDKEVIMKIVNIILNNPYCCREEIKKTTLNESSNHSMCNNVVQNTNNQSSVNV